MASSCSFPMARESAETRRTVPLLATACSHCLLIDQGRSGVNGMQSGSSVKNVLCSGRRKASVFTPVRRVRSHSLPLTSSPVREESKSPTDGWPIVLHPRMMRSSPQLERRRVYSKVTISTLVSVRLLKCQFPCEGDAPI